MKDSLLIKCDLIEELRKFEDDSDELMKIIAFANKKINTKNIGTLYGWEIIEDEE